MVEDGRVLGQDGDAALALKFVGVHHALDVGLVGAKSAALVQHGVNQGGLSVVHVRDDSDIAKTLAQNLMSFLLERTACDKANGGLNRLVSVYNTRAGRVSFQRHGESESGDAS